jgi:hypothetical protein
MSTPRDSPSSDPHCQSVKSVISQTTRQTDSVSQSWSNVIRLVQCEWIHVSFEWFGSVRFIWSSTKKLWTGGRALSPADPIRIEIVWVADQNSENTTDMIVLVFIVDAHPWPCYAIRALHSMPAPLQLLREYHCCTEVELGHPQPRVKPIGSVRFGDPLIPVKRVLMSQS